MEGDTYTFNHALTQQALYVELPPRRRRRLHLAAGEALERLPENRHDRRSTESARHFLQAGKPERALPYVLAAGEQADGVFAFSEAERQYRTALDLAKAIQDESQTVTALERLGHVQGNLGRYRDALETLEEAAHLTRARGDHEGEARVAARIGWTHAMIGATDTALARIQPVIDELTGLGPTFGLARLYETLVRLMYQLNRHDDQFAAAEQMATIAQAVGDERLFASAMVQRGWALLNLGRRDEMIQTSAQAIPLLEAAGDLYTLRLALVHIGDAHADRGEFSAARTFKERALVIAERLGEPGGIAHVLCHLGWIALWMGNWSEARAYAQRADVILRTVEVSVVSGGPTLLEGYICLDEGRWNEAAERLERVAEEARRKANRDFLLGAQYGLATLDLWTGHPDSTVRRLAPLLVGASDDERMPVFLLLGEASLAAGDLVRTEELVAEVVPWARAQLNRFLWANALRVQGELWAAHRRWDAAASALDEALSLTLFMGAPREEARIRSTIGNMHLQRGATDQARSWLREAHTLFTQLGASGHAERVAQALTSVEPL